MGVMTCKFCKVAMRQESHSHLSHGNRKWRCPNCKRARMQKPKGAKKPKGGTALN